MKNRVVAAAIGATVLSLAIGQAGFAEEMKVKKAAKPHAMDEKAMMEAGQKASTPGPEHAKLAGMEGTWDAETTMWTAPGAAPMTSKGTSENKMAFGGRFLQQTLKADFQGMPFEGMGLTGYDNVQKKYVGMWVDNMGTGIMMSEGKAAADGKPMKFTAKYPDPMTGKMAMFDETITVADADHHTFEMWTVGPGGKKFKTLESRYSRKK